MNKEKKEKHYTIYTEKTFELNVDGKKQKLTIKYDEYADAPWDFDEGFLSTIYCFDRHYTIGLKNDYKDLPECLFCLAMNDKHLTKKQKQYIEKQYYYNYDDDCGNLTHNEFCRKMINYLNRNTDLLLVELFLHEYSGDISISTTGNEFDGCSMVAILEKQKFLEMTCIDEKKKNWRKCARKTIEIEVKMLDAYAQGYTFEYSIENVVKCETCGIEHTEIIDEMAGFYGNDIYTNGIYTELPLEWQQYFNNLVNGGA